MAAVTICSDFGAQENKVCHYFNLFPIYLPWSDGSRCHDLRVFIMLSFKPAFSLSSFTFKRLFSFSLLSVIKVVPSAYMRLLIFLLAILIPAWTSSNLGFAWYTQHRSSISRMTMYILDTLFPQFWTSSFFHVHF